MQIHAHTHAQKERKEERRRGGNGREQEENPLLPPQGLKGLLYSPFQQNVDPDFSYGILT